MQIKKIVLLLALLVGLSGCASPGMMSELQQGKRTFDAGQYQKAFHQLLPIAIYGRREAQYAIGYMYYYGLGVAPDQEAGIDWMKKSAEQEYKPAMSALTALKG